MKNRICAVFLFMFLASPAFSTEFGDIPENYPLYSPGDPFAIVVATNAYSIATNANTKANTNKVSIDSLESQKVNTNETRHIKFDTLSVTNGVSLSSASFDTDYVTTGSEEIGTMFWDSGSKTAVIVYPNGQRLNIGEENCVAVQNDTGSTITNGMVVMYAGSIGNSGNVRVVPAYVTSVTDVHKIYGMATTDIPDGEVGKVTWAGKVRGIQTNGGQVGETWTNTVELYVTTNPAYAGFCTSVKPEAPCPAVRVAKVTAAHANNGTYDVHIERHCKVTDLSDVNGTPLTANGQIMVWDNDRGVFDFNYNLFGRVATNDTRYLAALTNADAFASSSHTNDATAHASLFGAKVSTNDATYLETVSKAATAWQNPASATNWTWTSDGTSITLTGYTGPNDVVIPDMLDGKPVTRLNGNVFSFKGSPITSVSGGLTSISGSAFASCPSLTTVSFPKALSIEGYVFSGSYALTNAYCPQATAVGDGAFFECMGLSSVIFSQSAPAESENVFYGLTPGQVTIYVDNPTATGWKATWNGMPVVRMPVYADSVTILGTNVTDMISAQTTGKVDRAGDTMTGALLTTRDYTTSTFANDEVPTAGWVRSLAMQGQELFFTSTVTNGFGSKTANFVALSTTTVNQFTNTIASPVASSTYLVGGISTNLYGSIRSPISLEVYANRTGGNATSIVPVTPEIYYVYNGTTNQLGDWATAPQVISVNTTPTRYMFTIAFPEPTITGAVRVVGYLKSGTVSGSACGLQIYGGGIYPSHMDVSGVPAGETASAVQANLDAHKVEATAHAPAITNIAQSVFASSGAVTNNNAGSVNLNGILTASTSASYHDIGYLRINAVYGEATIGHKSLDNTAKFAFTQNSTGNTVFNGAVEIYFRLLNVTKAYYNANEFVFNINQRTTGNGLFTGTLTASNTVQALNLKVYDYGTSAYRNVVLSNGVFIAQ